MKRRGAATARNNRKPAGRSAKARQRRFRSKAATLARSKVSNSSPAQAPPTEPEVTLLSKRVTHLQMECDALIKARNEYLHVFDSAPIGYALLDHEGIIRQCNRQLVALTRMNPTITPRFLFISLVAAESTQQFLDHWRQCNQAGHAQVELNLRKITGEKLPVLLVSQFLRPHGNSASTGIQIAVIDQSERVALAEKVGKTQRDYFDLINNIEGMVWEAEASNFGIVFISRSAEQFLGYPLERWYQPGFWEERIHVDDRERVMSRIARSIAQGEPLHLEYRVVTAERKLKWIHHRMSVRDHHGQARVCSVAMDITERIAAEQELHRTQDFLETRVQERTSRLQEMVAELESFSYSLSHDMRAPLRSIQGYSHVLLNLFGESLGANGRDYLQRIMNSAERLDRLIQDVLNYTKLSRTPIQLGEVDLEKVVEAILQDYNGFQWPKAEIIVQKPLLPVVGHEGFLTQCISNLLSNAVKFVRQDESARVVIRAEMVHSKVRLWVEDNGIGIAPADYDRIFGMFQRLNPTSRFEGTGIGLAIVQRAVERMGGQVGVYSELGQGSRFWVQLAMPGGGRNLKRQ